MGRDGNIRDQRPGWGAVWVEQFKIKMRPGWGAVWVEMEITAIMAPEESRLGRTIQNQNAPRMGCRLGRNGNNRNHGPVRGLVWVEQFKIKMRPGWGAVWVEMEITAIMAPEESRMGRTIQNQNAPRMGCRMGRTIQNQNAPRMGCRVGRDVSSQRSISAMHSPSNFRRGG